MKDVVLIEAASNKSSYQRKYKCPYCEQKYERSKLHIHIQNKHEDLIPEGYTALRVAFNTINNKTEGHCIMCGKISDWNEDKGRYERLCNDPKCHEAYKKMAAERNKKKYGTERLQTDPRYAEEVQRKALQGRRIAGKYKFPDGTEIDYLGAYERRFLEFMDKVMNCKAEDIAAPGPTIRYMWNGAEHLYISDFYYIPYNLIVEIKDGGDNPNNNPAIRGYKVDRQKAKEAAVEAAGKYNYIRLTNNDFGQLMSIMAVLKYNLQNECYDPIMRINEMTLLESILFNEKDIYYNKDKFDFGEINLCFITGHSGSGKSTMARDMQKDNVEHYELDDLQCIKDHFTMAQLKEYGDLIYSYFNGPGKKFYITYKELVDKKIPGSEYEDKLFPGFVHYAMQYAKSHKDRKYVIEGVWLFDRDESGSPYFKPEEFKDYAFYIKGTSLIISKYRAAKRDAKLENDKQIDILRYTAKGFFKNWKWYFIDEKQINRFRNYFKKILVNEFVLYESDDTSKLDKNFKHKSGIDFDIVDIRDKKVKNNIDKVKEKYKNYFKGFAAFEKGTDNFAGFIRIWPDWVLEEKYHGNLISPVEVKPKYRGYGLGRLLVEKAMEKYNANMLMVAKDNEVAIDMYKKLGFSIDQDKKWKNEDYYIMITNSVKIIKSTNEVTEDMSGTIGAALAPTAKGSSIIKPASMPTLYKNNFNIEKYYNNEIINKILNSILSY